jgi:integrase
VNKVQPIKDPEKLRRIQEELASRTDWHSERMFLLFELGIHTGLRISDLIRLRKKNVCGEWIEMVEKKTQKVTRIPLTVTIRMIIQDRCREMSDDQLLFPSRMKLGDGTQHPITTRCAYDDMQQIARLFNLDGRSGCHTLRKTFGYWHYKQNRDLELLRQWFNHASQSVTLRYIGMDEDEKRKSVQGFNPGGMVYQPRESVRRGRPDQVSEHLEINRLDRAKQGKILGQRAQEARQKRI